jgi:hypothetical protein
MGVDPADGALALDHFNNGCLLWKEALNHVPNHRPAERNAFRIVSQRQGAKLFNLSARVRAKRSDRRSWLFSNPNTASRGCADLRSAVCSKLISMARPLHAREKP